MILGTVSDGDSRLRKQALAMEYHKGNIASDYVKLRHQFIQLRLPMLDGWSSGFMGLMHVLGKHSAATVHIFGMNWMDYHFEHPSLVEHEIVMRLVRKGRVIVHETPTNDYHITFPDRSWVQGHRCGEWVPWWHRAFTPLLTLATRHPPPAARGR